ncbi:uncharacterized protein F4822DRAFT_437131 [Hypoxylon trugodes]|uniref:uncharacterized protein n=1 Tax=Hypoxylon trugodes TaxID=326681 RepID=UPI002190E9CC|nr:uncharacterized protein F4822DRAFT_437131 [Hypoxylon trugodes]KAI1390088.1 hypothetical protein F4822DRAFT_437131 [Hypoxylon trugodes]
MATARKRPRADLEESQAECPFSVCHPDPNGKEKNAKRRRQESEEHPQPKILLQPSPFAFSGEFKDPNNTMDRHYQVQPYQKWMDMTRYNSFVLNGVKYFSEGFIYVANNSTIERQKNPGEASQPRKKSDDDWVARILEIRASDEHHVYARVYWMYWPDELPPGTHDGKRCITGRQWYHGANELIASNHMDVINVVSVTAAATVNQWDENNEDEVQAALYWRQAFDVRSLELSSAELRCKCNRPENPDKSLIGCSNDNCKKWLHDECLIHDALLKTYDRLGIDKPYMPTPVKKEEAEQSAKRPLSPSETGAAQTAEQSIDVKAEDRTETFKFADVESPANDSKKTNGIVKTENKKRGRPRKSESSDPTSVKPYEGLFKATLIEDDPNAPVLEITDLRKKAMGGDKSWTEPLHCLVCNHEIK